MAFIKRHLLPLMVLAAVAAFVYRDLPSQSFLSNWDDALYVTGNASAHGFSLAHIREAFSGFFAGNYAPLQILSYMLDYEIWGKWAGGYKLVNLLFHIGTGLLFYLILVSRFSATRLAAFSAVALFLFHPVQVESVAWISQRKTVMSGLFMLLSLWAYMRYRERGRPDNACWQVVAVTAYTASLLCKATTVVLLPLLVIYDALVHRRPTFRDKLPFVFATVIMVVVTLISQSPDNHGGISQYHGGSPWATLLTMVTVLPRYLYLVLWPVRLSAVYMPAIHKTVDLAVVLSLCGWFLLGWLGFLLVRRQPRAAFWYLMFFVGLLPVSQVVPIVTIMNDRYLYLPMLGVAGGLACLVQSIQKLPGVTAKAAVVAVLFLVTIPLPVTAARQVKVWREGTTLWQTATERCPESPEAWTGLGHAFQNDEKIAAALGAYVHSIQLKPDNDIALNNVALIYLSLGKPAKAEQYAKRLLTVNKSAVSCTTMAMVHFAKREYDQAEAELVRALSKEPTLETALTLMGSVATEQGKYDLAEKYLLKSLELHGPIAPVLSALAILNGATGKNETSARLLVRSLEAGYKDTETIRTNPHLSDVVARADVREAVNRFLPHTLQ